MKEYYTIGETAKMFNVSSDTLRYYDKLNLITPWYVGENGYRYYSKAQFEMISNIMRLAKIGTPLARIREILNSSDSRALESELNNYIDSIDKKIARLESLKEQTRLFSKNIKDTVEADAIKIETINAYLLLKEYNSETDEFDISEIIEANRSTKDEWSSFANVISTAGKDDVLSGNFHTYKSYGYMSEFPCETDRKDLLKVIENKKYLTACALVSTPEHNEVDPVYRRMLSYIEKNKLSVDGDIIERNVFDLYLGSNKELAIYFKIYIPIK